MRPRKRDLKVAQLAQGYREYEGKRGRDAVKPAGRGGLRG